MAAIGPQCLTPAMKEQRFPHRPPSTATRPPLLDSDRTEIPISWNGGVVMVVGIRHEPNALIPKARSINLQPAGRSGLDRAHTMATQAKVISGGGPFRHHGGS